MKFWVRHEAHHQRSSQVGKIKVLYSGKCDVQLTNGVILRGVHFARGYTWPVDTWVTIERVNRDWQVIGRGPAASEVFIPTEEPVVITVLGVWHAAMQESAQNPLGNYVNSTKQSFVGASNAYLFKTKDNNTGGTGEQFSSYGLTRVQLGAEIVNSASLSLIDYYVLAYPVQRQANTSLCDLQVGGYHLFDGPTYSKGDLAWSKTFTVGVAFPHNESPNMTAKLYYNAIGRRVNFCPYLSGASPKLYSAKEDDGDTYANATFTFDKPAYGWSSHSYKEDEVAKSAVVLPYLDPSSGGTYLEIKVYSQSIVTGALTLESTLTSDNVVGTGYNTVQQGRPDTMSGVPWYQNKFFVFGSGVTPDNVNCRWAFKSFTVEGAVSISIEHTYTALSNPPGITQFYWDSEATAPGIYAPSGDYYLIVPGPGVVWVSDTAMLGSGPSMATWSNIVPLQLPAPETNSVKFSGFPSSLCSVWPAQFTAYKNSQQQLHDGTVAWFCYLKPVQRQVGGGWGTEIEVANAVQTYQWFYTDSNSCEGYLTNTNGYTRNDYHPGPAEGVGVTTGTSPLVITTYPPVCNPPENNGIAPRTRTWSIFDVGLKTERTGVWIHANAYTWETQLVAVDLATGMEYVTDISQQVDLDWQISFTSLHLTNQPVSNQTLTNAKVADNVWQWISLPGKNVIAVLRDVRRAPNGDPAFGNLPVPALEIYDYSGGFSNMPMLSRVILGTTEVFQSGIGDTIQEQTTVNMAYDDSQGPDGQTFIIPAPPVPPPGYAIVSVDDCYLNEDEGSPVTYTFNAPDEVVLDVPIADPDFVTIKYTFEYILDLAPGADYGDRVWDPHAISKPVMKAASKFTVGGAERPIIQVAIYENKRVDTAFQSEFQRVVFHAIDLNNPSSPVVSTDTQTSNDLGVGNGSEPPSGDFPWVNEWGSVVMAGGTMTWTKDSNIRELV